MSGTDDWIGQVNWNREGLVPVVAQDQESGRVLTLAWMNREALLCTVTEGRAVYWSRSRGRLWRKGEESGHVQWVKSVRLDCDRDTVLLTVRQEGGVACHTGRASCFFMEFRDGAWHEIEPVIEDPARVYGRGK